MQVLVRPDGLGLSGSSDLGARLRTLIPFIGGSVLLGMLAGCGGEQEDPSLAAGKAIWEKNCRVCHQQGLGGAPMIGNQTQWQSRIEQGIDVLIGHAQQGYSGQTGVMPARGGNPDLTDEQVALAVRYMVSESH